MGTYDTPKAHPFEIGARVRVVRYDKDENDKSSEDFTGATGIYRGWWRTYGGAGEECPDVMFPCSVLLDGQDEPRVFKPDELQICT